MVADILVVDGTPQNDPKQAENLNRFHGSLRLGSLGILEAPDDHGNCTVRLNNPTDRTEVMFLAQQFGLRVIG